MWEWTRSKSHGWNKSIRNTSLYSSTAGPATQNTQSAQLSQSTEGSGKSMCSPTPYSRHITSMKNSTLRNKSRQDSASSSAKPMSMESTKYHQRKSPIESTSGIIRYSPSTPWLQEISMMRCQLRNSQQKISIDWKLMSTNSSKTKSMKSVCTLQMPVSLFKIAPSLMKRRKNEPPQSTWCTKSYLCYQECCVRLCAVSTLDWKGWHCLCGSILILRETCCLEWDTIGL